MIARNPMKVKNDLVVDSFANQSAQLTKGSGSGNGSAQCRNGRRREPQDCPGVAV